MSGKQNRPAAATASGDEWYNNGDLVASIVPHPPGKNNVQILHSTRLTVPETLASVAQAGGSLVAADGDLRLVMGDEPAQGLLDALVYHRDALVRYVAEFPKGRWPGWGAR